MVAGAIGSPYVPLSHSFSQNDVAIIRCENSPGEDTVATEVCGPPMEDA